jgi:hypothetical protein
VGYFPFRHCDKTVPSASHFELTRQTLMKIIHIQNSSKTDSKTRLCFYRSHQLGRWNKKSISKRRYIRLRRWGTTQKKEYDKKRMKKVSNQERKPHVSVSISIIFMLKKICHFESRCKKHTYVARCCELCCDLLLTQL